MTRTCSHAGQLLLACLGALTLGGCAASADARADGPKRGADAAELLIVNARIHGVGGADAVLIRGRRIAAIGRGVDLREREEGRQRTTIDAQGGLLLPGLVDAHCHVLSGAQALRQLDLGEAKDVGAVQAAVRAWAATHPDEAWLRGRGWTFNVVPDGKTLTRQQLDAAVADRPVVLESYDGHALWANSKALERAGITGASANPPAGEIVREADGQTPSGLLLEDAMDPLEAAIPGPDAAERRRLVLAGLRHLARQGLCGVDAIAGDLDEALAFEALAREGALPLRVTLWLPLGGDLDAYAALRERLPADGLLRVGHLKGFVDGVIEAKTAFLLEPYATPGGGGGGVGGGEERGTPAIPRERLFELVERAHARRFPVALHAIGDAAVRLSLDACEAARKKHPEVKLRHRIEHIEVVHPDDLPRFRALDVVASMQPIHADPGAEPDEGAWSKNLGPARLKRSFAWRDLLDAGAVLAFGSDWPVMSANPLAGLAVATTRQSREGLPAGGWNAHQKITPAEAVRAYAFGPAYAQGREAELGALEVGKLADLVVVGPPVALAAPEALWRGRPLHLVVDGRVVLLEGAPPLEREGGHH